MRGSSHPSAKMHKCVVKLACSCRQPRTRGSFRSLEAQNPTSVPGCVRSCPSAKECKQDRRLPAGSGERPGLRYRSGQPPPFAKPTWAGVEAGSLSFIFVSRKDSNY